MLSTVRLIRCRGSSILARGGAVSRVRGHEKVGSEEGPCSSPEKNAFARAVTSVISDILTVYSEAFSLSFSTPRFICKRFTTFSPTFVSYFLLQLFAETSIKVQSSSCRFPLTLDPPVVLRG